ncbi:primase-helicase family protein [Dysgonomonas sp. ZJ279]|uniref:primase-helicase family protein n=1 Tax=Dysgonomonas sp. ZJ279 TaxID=2709796 RepID=UPI0013EAD10E|nr:primase-helicase family protein [Dysgonomonas sp. ZJ279]
MSEIPYIRVGTSYFKIVKAPTISGEYIEILIIWNIDTIKQDESKDYISQIPKYDGFTCIPNHINYQKEYGTFFNTYFPLSNVPKEGKVDNTLNFLKHIFGKQIELGLDYLQLLYLKPIQILPILCLVSKQRATGKSTFLKWLKQVFDGNMTYLTNDSFSSQFNADWANKLLICIDEVLFNKEELTERIKYLSTTNINKMEAKGKDKREVEFFGKFVLCSNNEDSFIKIDADEIRFWVIKVPKLTSEDTNLLQKLVKEIPAFLFFLQNRELKTKTPLSRMWFTPEQIKTSALLKLVRHNRSRVEKELASLLISVMEKFDLEQINVCSNDVLNALSRTRVKTDLTEVKKIFKQNWSLEPQSNSNKYEKFVIGYDGDYLMNDAKGRYFTIKKEFLLQNFDDLMTE